MNTDLYTKAILTLIAVGLFMNIGINSISNASAYGRGDDVRVTNYETDIKAGETLYVYCTNCN